MKIDSRRAAPRSMRSRSMPFCTSARARRGRSSGAARKDSAATPSPSPRTVASPTPSTERATSMARADGAATSTSIVPPPPMARELLLGALRDDLAALDDEQTVTGLADLGQNVAREQDRVRAAQRADHVAHLDDLHGV